MSVDTIGKVQKLGAHIKCFICEELIKMSEIRKFLADYSLETYLSTSNFYTHIQIHQKKGEMANSMQISISDIDDDGETCDNTGESRSVQSSKYVLKNAPKYKQVLNRFLSQKHGKINKYGSTGSTNRLKMQNQPHTVTTQVKKGCEPFPKSVDEQLELDKTDKTSSQETKKNKKWQFANMEFEERLYVDVENKCKRKKNNRSAKKSATVSRLGLDSQENCEEISTITTDHEIVDLAEDTDNDLSVEELSYRGSDMQSTIKDASRYNLSNKKKEINGFRIEEEKENFGSGEDKPIIKINSSNRSSHNIKAKKLVDKEGA